VSINPDCASVTAFLNVGISRTTWPPKLIPNTSSGAQSKKQRYVLTPQEKMAAMGLVREVFRSQTWRANVVATLYKKVKVKFSPSTGLGGP
jgi:hypothetical protein